MTINYEVVSPEMIYIYIQVILNELSMVYLCGYVDVTMKRNHEKKCEREQGVGHMGKAERRKGENDVIKCKKKGK